MSIKTKSRSDSAELFLEGGILCHNFRVTDFEPPV